MSQFDYGTIDPTTKSGSALAGDLNSFRDALHSTHKGPAAPSYAVAGLRWIDDTGDPWLLKVYDGADWIIEAVIDTTNNVSYPLSVNPVLAYPTAGGSANALTLTPAIPMTSYANGAKVTFTAASTNSGAVTLNVSGVGAKAIRTIAAGADIALVAGNLQAGRKYEVVYSLTANSGAGAWILVNLPIGTTAGTVPAGDDSRITGALQRAGGAMTGDLTLKGDPTTALMAATKQYVDASGGVDYQEFLTSGTWTKPTGLADDAIVIVEIWGGGGGGSNAGGTNGAGGGGGAYNRGIFRASELTANVSVTIGAGGQGYTTTTTGGVGGTSSFGTYLTAYGGGGGGNVAGGSGGGITSSGAGGTTSPQPGGGPAIGGSIVKVVGTAATASPLMYGGTSWQDTAGAADSIYGGGAGYKQGAGNAGNSVYGGAGGGGSVATTGTSIFGGNGGGLDEEGHVPGGGGGRRANGAAGKAIVRVIR
jgi:hypothetical protein